jgi:uncharacterized protein (DUF58 family)
MIKPTRRTVLLFISGLPLSLIVVILEPSLWTLCAAYMVMIFFAMAADAVLALPSKALRIGTNAPTKIYIGEKESLTLTFEPVRYRRPSSIEILLEQRGELERPALTTFELPPRKATDVILPLVPLRRGLAHLDRLWLRWKGPWSLVQFVHKIGVGRTVEVVPNVRGARNAILRYIAQETIFGEKVQEKGEGAEFESLREYVPGLDIRFIDWKRSAKHRKPLSKEFRTERNHHVILAFDTGHLMLEPLGAISRLDHAINAALPLAWVGLQSGDFVGTYGFDAKVRHYQAPLRGSAAFGRLQRATAEISYHSEETNFTLGLAELSARLRRRALVILFTDFVDTVMAELMLESVQRLTQRHAIIFVTLKDSYLQETADRAPNSFQDVARAVIAQDFLHDRRVVFERLARMGVHCLDVSAHALSVRLINRYLQIKQRGSI